MTQKKRRVLTGGRVVDPASGIDELRDVCIDGKEIVGVDKPGAFSKTEGAEVINVSGMIVVPGLVDVHVHLREPGYEWKETVETGSRAAASGGFTAVCSMPNTDPVNDRAQVTEYIYEKSQTAGLAKVYPIGAITEGSKGENLAPMLELREAGCVAFSDDGHCVQDSGIMRRALEYAKMLGVPLAVHEEDTALSEGFSMNESVLSVKLGLKGMPAAAENVMISRDIELARLTGGRLHICHVSTARGVELIRRAKEDGVAVTAETAPHYISLTEEAIGEFNTLAKVSMPLRSAEDVAGLIQGIKEGVIDCVASDHAPHEMDSKEKEFSHASFGMIGLQTSLSLVLEQVRRGRIPLLRAVDALSSAPARCFNLESRAVRAGAAANLTVIDMERKYVFTQAMNRSKSRNGLFFGVELQGMAVRTIVDGRDVFDVSELN